jgi:hypothetical protein
MLKGYLGNVPSEADGWQQIGSCQDGDGADWLVFAKSQGHDPEWQTLKIVANGRAQGKANYWFGLHAKTGRVAFSRDAALLAAHRPKLHAAVTALLEGQHGH